MQLKSILAAAGMLAAFAVLMPPSVLAQTRQRQARVRELSRVAV